MTDYLEADLRPDPNGAHLEQLCAQVHDERRRQKTQRGAEASSSHPASAALSYECPKCGTVNRQASPGKCWRCYL